MINYKEEIKLFWVRVYLEMEDLIKIYLKSQLFLWNQILSKIKLLKKYMTIKIALFSTSSQKDRNFILQREKKVQWLRLLTANSLSDYLYLLFHYFWIIIDIVGYGYHLVQL